MVKNNKSPAEECKKHLGRPRSIVEGGRGNHIFRKWHADKEGLINITGGENVDDNYKSIEPWWISECEVPLNFVDPFDENNEVESDENPTKAKKMWRRF